MTEATTYMIIDDMFRARPIVYADFLGYDEIAHHAGPGTPDALHALRRVDRKLHSLELAARSAPRPYQFVVLSDHGQSTGATFRQRYGYTLADLVRMLVADEESIGLAGGQGEGWSHVNIVLSEILRAGGLLASAVRRVLPRKAVEESDVVNLGPDAETEESVGGSDVVICASGNLALVYFTGARTRLSLEALQARYPNLISGLTAHPGVGFLLVLSDERGPLVLGSSGIRELETGAIDGEDPLASFEPSTAEFLRRLSGFDNAPDIVVNSLHSPDTGEVCAFEELIGCHGGAGGLQTRPFLLYPAPWTADNPTIRGPEAMHEFLSLHALGQTMPGEQATGHDVAFERRDGFPQSAP
jgi:hypothetical protein